MTLKGHINQFFETGCEGICWEFFEDSYDYYKAMRILDEGDHLKIFGEKGEILFDGVIEKDRQSGWQPYSHVVRKYKNHLKRNGRGKLYVFPCNSAHGQPCALGYWIHWTQKGWDPDEWAKLFFHQHLTGNEGKPPLRAELTKNEFCIRCKKNKKDGAFLVCETCRAELTKKETKQ